MTKQEEIREEMAGIRYRNDYSGKGLKEFIDLPPYLQNFYLSEVDQLLQFLDSQGVVIKVEGEMPQNPYKAFKINIDEHPEKTWDVAHSFGWRDGWECGKDAAMDAGYAKTERLIEEEK